MVSRKISLSSKYFENQEAFNTPDKFSFHEVSEDKVRQENLKLDGTNSTTVGDIPTDMTKSTINIHACILTKINFFF